MWAYDDRRWVIVDKCFLAVWALWFVYAVLSWKGFVGGEPWRPAALVLCFGGMTLQALASVMRRRSLVLFYFLLLTGLAAIAASLLVLFAPS
jgi:hypothetical protein